MQPLRSTILATGSEFYEISDEYDQGTPGFSGDYEYYGLLNIVGKWIIQRRQISTGAYRYVNGASDYSTAWANKEILTGYDFYHKMSNIVP